MTGSNSLCAIGAVPICTSFSRVALRWGSGTGVETGLDYPDLEVGRTFYQTLLLYNRAVRQRTLRGTAIRDDARSILQLNAASAQGRIYPFVVVPDEDVNSALWVRWSDTTFRYLRSASTVSTTEVVLEELVNGLTL